MRSRREPAAPHPSPNAGARGDPARSRRSPLTATLTTGLLAAVTGGIGVIDYLSGPAIGLSLFYLIPIVTAAWRVGRIRALMVAALAAAAWTVAEFAWHGVTAISAWNAFTRCGIYVGVAWLTARFKASREELLALNAKLALLLSEEKVRSRSDALTGLPNGRMFLEELRRAASASRRTRRPLTVGYLDLDHFKRLNDTLGHAAGNAVLCRVAECLRSQVRATDMAARIGGDEFGLLILNADVSVAEHLRDRIVAACASAIAEHTDLGLGITAGLVSFESPPDEPERMVHAADEAMYRAKRGGRNQVVVERA